MGVEFTAAKSVRDRGARVGVCAAALILLPSLAMPAEVASPLQRLGDVWRAGGAPLSVAVLAIAVGLAVVGIGAIVYARRGAAGRRRAARPLTGSDADRYRDFAASAADWFWEADERLRLTQVIAAPNAGATALSDDDVGRSFAELGIADPPPASLADFEARLGRHEPFRDLVFSRADGAGETRIFALSGVPVFGLDGGFRGYRGAGRDAAEAARREREQTSARRNAEEASEAKTAFIATVSHELRSPLNAIIGFSEVMGREVLGPLGSAKYVGYAHDISIAGQHMLSLVNDILDMAKLESGQQALEESEIDVVRTVEDSIAVVRQRAERARQTIEAKLAVAPPIHADARAVRQMLINLLTNAIKFTPEGGRITVESAVAENGGGLLLKVTDTGMGIAAADLQRLGKPFVQLRPGRQFADGAGLGLAITRFLVDLHGGALTIESTPGRGTTATLTLPASRLVTREPAAPPA